VQQQSVEFEDTSRSLTETLQALVSGIRGQSITLRELMDAVGEQGLLLLCAIASLPFLIPVSIPGISTVFGAAIILVGIAVCLNRLPWLPRRILDRKLDTAKLVPALERGIGIVGKFDRYVKPRMTQITGSAIANRINALAITIGGILLMFPLGLIPFSNTLPAVAILLIAVGMIQRDGLIILGGYAFLVGTKIYFAALAYAAFSAGQGLMSIFSS